MPKMLKKGCDLTHVLERLTEAYRMPVDAATASKIAVMAVKTAVAKGISNQNPNRYVAFAMVANVPLQVVFDKKGVVTIFPLENTSNTGYINKSELQRIAENRVK